MNFIILSPSKNYEGTKLILLKEEDFDSCKDKETLTKLGFKAKSETGVYLSSIDTLYVGCVSFEADEVRIACAKAWELLKSTTCKSLGVDAPNEIIEALVEGFELSSYTFETYKSKPETASLEDIILLTDAKDVALKVEHAKTIASCANLTKSIVNTIPNDYTPLKMAADAQELTKITGVTCEVYNEEYLKQEEMEAFLAVNRASVHPPRLIHLTYTPKQKAKKRIVYVGKGLTYDSGGLSLKPGEHMVTMKADKSGGAAALAILKGAALMELPFEVHAIIGATENMIGGNAYKPDDVLRGMNGTTIEVRNTDAEGRLVLADCLCYAQRLNADLLVDIATLTGACVVGIGEYTTGVMGHNKNLMNSLNEAAQKSGELTNSLYFNRHLKKLLKSNVADISNISSSRYGGAITAGLFLDHFIDDNHKEKWIHLDIAGPAYVEKPWGYNQAGASGAGVRMNLYWLKTMAKEVR
ncbi:MAG: leucyl aminopeptidase [Campylobacteraceae bacterium]|nr:leucyl aminopeptidase [Campylobacteraceae bacterium]